MGPNGLVELAAGAPLYRDDRPILDYAAGQEFVGGRETQHLDALRAHLEPVASLGQFDFSADADIDKIRASNLAAIAVGDLIKQVYDPDLSEEDLVERLEKALRLHPEHFEANLRLAQILTRQRRYEKRGAITQRPCGSTRLIFSPSRGWDSSSTASAAAPKPSRTTGKLCACVPTTRKPTTTWGWR